MAQQRVLIPAVRIGSHYTPDAMPSRVHFARLVVFSNLGVREFLASLCYVLANFGVMDETSSPRDQLCIVALLPTTCVANADPAAFLFSSLPHLLPGMKARISMG